MFGYTEVAEYPEFGPDKAQKLLAEAGFPKDLGLRTHFHSPSKRITGIVDKDIDAVLDKERNATTIEERKKILQTETLPMIAKKAPALALFTSVFIHAFSKKLDGLYIY